MKLKKIVAAVCLFALAGNFAVFAAEAGSDGAAPKRAPKEKAVKQTKAAPGEARGVIARLKKDLALSDEQVAKIQPILTQRRADLSANTKNKTQSAEENAANEKKIRDEANAKIRTLLNEEQQVKFDAYNAKIAERKSSGKKAAKKTAD